MFGFSEVCFVQFYSISPCCGLHSQMYAICWPTSWLTHFVVITGRPSMGTSGLGKSLLQRRVFLQEAGRQQKSRSNRGMRYLGSTSSILIGPEEQAGDSQIERWGILVLPRLYASAVYNKQETDEGPLGLSHLFSSSTLNKREKVKQTDAELRVCLVYTHQPLSTKKRQSNRRIRSLRSISLHALVLHIR